MSSRIKRLSKELEDVKKDPLAGVSLDVISEDDLSHLTGSFLGPPGTPYEGGLFKVDIQVPNEYPFKPPLVKFDTKIYHPNISSQTGAICLDILKGAWTPILTLKSTLISLQSLLQSPEPSDPQDAQVAAVYLKDLDEFNETAASWTKKFAPNPDYKPDSSATPSWKSSNKATPEVDEAAKYGIDDSTMKLFEDMGFPRSKIIAGLRKLNLKYVSQRDFDTQQRVIEELI
ncbi:unnamed protein product [Kuraishia capsulata CBS 1993]|uniref:Ubiquitin-conjugating enzyme E2 1 n=1 Tax=Kuraishia capsulata CBS 1993 TaxID=1382522 RepID=W6MXE2_9ASCO|nr:uncharacterized protein KUCA_T00004719001 [Kuraishia capsulata CBS 1993]CDK28735.1 unnamed protein product [Kuraishia capsulata CBS 1993]